MLTWVQWRTGLSIAAVVVVVGIRIYAIVAIVSCSGVIYEGRLIQEKAACVCISCDVSVDPCVDSECSSFVCAWSGRTEEDSRGPNKLPFLNSCFLLFLFFSPFWPLYFSILSDFSLPTRGCFGGLTLKCSEHSYIMGAGRWATSACLSLSVPFW